VRVGFVTTGFPRFEGDHSGSFLLTLARGLVAHGHEVRVLAPEPAEARPVPRWPGIEVSWVPYLRPRTLQRAFYGGGAPNNLRRRPARWVGASSFTAALRLASQRGLRDCDALLSSWCIPSGWVASSVARGRTHLCICHATDVRWLCRLPARAMIARQITGGATSMWFLSEAHRERFFELAQIDSASMPIHVGPMPIEAPSDLPMTRSELRRRLRIEGFTLLFLGRLVPVKGVRDLLFAVASMSEVRLRIAGDGPERDSLSSLCRQLGVEAVFEGWVAGERKEALLRACDALIVPSRQADGLPTVLFEGRARGLPIVATRAGAIPEALRGNTDVLLVQPGDPAALRLAIETLRAILREGA
jgi:glycosyltransferase involved in cell wall biosynthesis